MKVSIGRKNIYVSVNKELMALADSIGRREKFCKKSTLKYLTKSSEKKNKCNRVSIYKSSQSRAQQKFTCSRSTIGTLEKGVK